MKIKNIIIGAGITGITIAERLASKGEDVLIIERRNHIGGNCFDYYNKIGLLVPKYGPHFFHTNSKQVWNYLSNFTEWHKYEHKVLSNVDGKKLVPIPVNIDTINIIFGLNIKNEKEMSAWLKNNTSKIKNPKNSEESAVQRVGKIIYEKLFKNYTKKQWDLWPSELDPSIMNRIPVRTNFDDRYFTDIYQAMPKNGYTNLFKKMLNNSKIEIKLNTDFKEYKDKLKNFDKIFFTGRIDDFFEKKYGELQYRSLKFKIKTLNQEFFQTRAQINYPNTQKFTRITEPKHATGQKNKKTTIIYETSTWKGDAYYPVLNTKNKKLFEKYQKKANKLESKGIYFVGRLAEYKYYNMDQAFLNALNLIERLKYG